jgi:DNA/RNA-binding domain of Phe-tRNA-synthetase-like protein
MKFGIDKRIFEKFPGLSVGVVAARGINNAGESGEIAELLGGAVRQAREKYNTETLSQEPRIDAWRKAYSSFGAKPKKYKCSVENLYRMLLQGRELRHINRIVDIYNYVSIKHMVPVGGDDIDRVDGGIMLKFAGGSEPFVELNSEETKNPKEGEVVYADEKEVLCRRWNWRECDKSKMTAETRNAVLVTEGLPPVGKNEVEAIANELGELVQRFCGGEIKVVVLDSSEPEAEL